MNDNIIETNNNLTLRKWKIEDAKVLADIGNNINVWQNMTDAFPSPYTIEIAKTYIESTIDKADCLILAIEYDGKVAGSIGAFFHDDIYKINASLGYFVGQDYWGNGIGTLAIEMISRHLFCNFKINRIYAQPFENNTGSRRALEKAGFKFEALLRENIIKNGIIMNSCIYSYLREEFVLTTAST
jgi:RimJ/RimL family protein N-acetyltransferase